MGRFSILGIMPLIALPFCADAADLPHQNTSRSLPITHSTPRADQDKSQSWSGFYAGFNIGVLDAKSDIAWDSEVYNGALSTSCEDAYNESCDTTRLKNLNFFGSAKFGYNFTRDNWIFGPEFEVGYFAIKSKLLDQALAAPGSFVDTYMSVDPAVFESLSLRVGSLINKNTLLFIKGGASRYEGNSHVIDDCNSGGSCGGELINAAGGARRIGYVFSVGVDYRLNEHWLTNLEYNSFNFGSAKVEGANLVNTSRTDTWRDDLTVQSLKVGIDYLF